MVVCVLLPRFELAVAAGRRSLGEPVALAPEAGGVQAVGEASPAAEAFGVRAGMRLGEALARCPQLTVVAPDPIAVAQVWERVLERLEGIGAAVEPARPGEACFEARGLCRMHGGNLAGVLAQVRDVVRARIGVGPVRFCAVAAAHVARARCHATVGGAADLAPLPVALLGRRAPTAQLPPALERLGIATLGELAALERSAVGERFGPSGLLAHDLAGGHDTPLRPRVAGETLEEELELPEAAGGQQLERALGLLVDRLLARRERRGRTLRCAVLSARLVAGGTWRERVVFREATADAARIRLAAAARLALLPAPAQALSLSAEGLGPPHPRGDALFEDGAAHRDARLREAVRQVRAVAGPGGALRVLVVDPDSRVPERHAVLTPFEP